MKELFLFIQAAINTNLPEFKTVRVYNDQYGKSNAERTEKALGYPACLIQFVTSEIRSRSLGIQDVMLQVIFHLAYEGYKYSETRQLEDMELTAKFDSFIHRLRGTEEDPVQFTTMQRTILNEAEIFNNVNTPILTYFTMWRCMGSYKALTPLTDWNYEIDGTVTTTN